MEASASMPAAVTPWQASAEVAHDLRSALDVMQRNCMQSRESELTAQVTGYRICQMM